MRKRSIVESAEELNYLVESRAVLSSDGWTEQQMD